jgi:uncharacterized protein YceK
MDMRTVHVVVIPALVLTLAGCASIHRHQAASMAQWLAEAGFQRQSADGPEAVPELQSLPPLKVVGRSVDGIARYTVWDPYRCRCLYVGGAKEYSAYRRLVTQRQEAAEERLTAEQDRMNREHWSSRFGR